MSKKVQKKIIKFYIKFFSIIHYFKFFRKVHKIFWIFLQNISGRKNFKNNKINKLNIKKNNQIFQIIRTLNKQGYLIVEKNEIQDYLQKMHNLVIKKSNEIISNRNLLNKGYKGFKDYFQKIDINNFGNEYKLLLYKYFTNPFFIQIASNYLKDNALLTALNIRISPKETNIEINLKDLNFGIAITMTIKYSKFLLF